MTVVGYPKIYNLTLTNANQEYSQALDNEVRYFEVKCRTLNDMKMAFVSGESGVTYLTIPAGSMWFTRALVNADLTLYLQSPDAGVVAEIMQWT